MGASHEHVFSCTMSTLHTWTGLLLGWVLYFMFVTGTLGYLDTEIDRWMKPELPKAQLVTTPEKRYKQLLITSTRLRPKQATGSSSYPRTATSLICKYIGNRRVKAHAKPNYLI